MSYSLVSAHHTAGTALQASGVFEGNLIVLESVAVSWANDETGARRTGCADRLVDQNMRITFVHTESVQCKQLFRA